MKKGLKRFFATVGIPAIVLVASFFVFRFEEVKGLFVSYYTTFSWEMIASVAITAAVAGYMFRTWMLRSKQERRKKKLAQQNAGE